MKHILLVDNQLESLEFANKLLHNYYKVSLITSSKEALEFCEKYIPDLILLEISMPQMNGFEVINKLKENPRTAKIPVIFLSETSYPEIEAQGFEYGAVDFITKPFAKISMLHRIDTHLQLSAYQLQLESMVKELEDSIITNFSQLIECRDNETGGHVERTKRYVEILAHELMKRGKFPNILSESFVENLARSAPLHDIGKIGVSDLILMKPDSLTQEEIERMKTHTTIGAEVLEKIMKSTPSRHYLEIGKEIAESHHERFDGKGYPYGLKGEEIPLSGRIMAVADVYDALVSDRVYRKGMSQEEACEIILNGRGVQFDPEVIDAFIEVKDVFYKIAKGQIVAELK